MAEVLSQWLNLEVKLSKQIDISNLASSFANGMLFAELFWRCKLLENIEEFEDKQTEKAVRKNYSKLRPIFHELGIKLTENIIKKLKNADALTVIEILYKVFVSLESRKCPLQCGSADRPVAISRERVLALRDIQDTMAESLETCRRLQEMIASRDNDLQIGMHTKQQRFKKLLEDRSKHIAALARTKGQGDEPLREKKTVSCRAIPTVTTKDKEIETTYAEMELFEKKKTQRCEHRQALPDSSCCILLEQKLRQAKKDKEKLSVPHDMGAFSQKIANEEYLEKIRRQLQLEMELRLQRKQNRTQCIENSINIFESTEREQIKDLMVDVLLRRSRFEKKIINELMHIRKEKATLLQSQKLRAEQMAKIRELEFSAAMDDEQRQIEIANHSRKEQIQKDWEFHKLLLAKQEEQCHKSHQEMCQEIISQIIDLSICISAHMELTKNKIPPQMWRNWKALFIEGKQFFEEAPFDALYEPLEVNIEDIEKEELRQNYLNEIDFLDYKDHLNAWKTSSCELERFDFERSVIGHVVYKILDLVYPFPPPLRKLEYPFAPLRGCILGKPCIGKSAALEKIIDKMNEACEVPVKVITLQEAVEECIQSFRNFESIISSSESEDLFVYDTVNTASVAPTDYPSFSDMFKGSEMYSSSQLEKTSSTELITSETLPDQTSPSWEREDTAKTEEQEETETVKEQEPVEMTPLAVLGHLMWDSLKAGHEIDDSLIIKIILEIIRSFPSGMNIIMDGFPTTAKQAKLLDEIFTGYHTPEDLYRMMCETEQEPSIQVLRSSKIVDNPDPPAPPPPPKCIFDIVIYLHAEDNQVLEWASEYTASTNEASDFNQFTVHSKLNCFNKHWPSLEEYYGSRGILHIFQASKDDGESWEIIKTKFLDLIKYNTKLHDVALEESSDVSRVASEHILFKHKAVQFPSEHEVNIEQMEENAIIANSSEKILTDVIGDGTKDGELISEKDEEYETAVTPSQPASPGDKYWEFIEEDLPQEIATSLAVLWQNMEMRYINTLKSMFCKLRNYTECLIRMFHSVQEDFLQFLKRPDDKQEFVNQWIEEYNNIPEDMQDDDETKAELHKRLNDLKHFLWSISDKRLHEAKHELSDIVNSGWLQEWLALIVNCYVCILQTEVDRFYDTSLMLKDYYDGIEGVILTEFTLESSPKIPLIDFHEASSSGSEITSENIETEDQLSTETTKVPVLECTKKTKLLYNEDSPSSSSLQEELKDSLQQCFHKSYAGAVQGVKETVENLFQYQNEDSLNIQNVTDKKLDKKGRVQPKAASPEDLHQVPSEILNAGIKLLKNPKEKIKLERNAAFKEEENRVLTNLWLIHQNAIQTIEEFEEHARNVYSSLEYWMKIQYNNEINSIQNVCNSIGYAIEEERTIDQELNLESEKIDASEKILPYVKSEEKPSPLPEEPVQTNRFLLKQIDNLSHQFSFIAPSGFLIACAFESIMNDLANKEADFEMLPEEWKNLDPVQVHKLTRHITNGYNNVNWRRFLLALAKPWPYPSVMELLNVLDKFNAIDDNQNRLITEKQFENIELWFSISPSSQELPPHCPKPFNRFANLKNTFFSIFSSDGLHIDYLNMLMYFAANVDPIKGFIRALSVTCGYPVDDDFPSGYSEMSIGTKLKKIPQDGVTHSSTARKFHKTSTKSQHQAKLTLCENAKLLTLADVKTEEAKPTITIKENPQAEQLLEECELYANMYGMDTTYNDMLVHYLQNSIMEFEECLIPFSSVFYVFLCGLHNFEGGHLCLTERDKLKEKLENIFIQLGSAHLEPVLFSNLINHPPFRSMICEMTFFTTLDIYEFFENEIQTIFEESS